MLRIFWRTLAVLLLACSAAIAAPNGEDLYRHHCAGCHGPEGHGDGSDAAIFTARPRDLRDGILQKTSTDDLVRKIRDGRALPLDVAALRARATDTEALVAHIRRIAAADWILIDAGQEVYIDRCEPCHAWDGSPGSALPSGVKPPRDLSSADFQKSVSDRDLVVAVRHGHQGMPALVPRISESDAKALAAFVRLLSPGYREYSRSCAGCHGDDGRGVGTLGEAIPRPTVVFNEQYVSTHDPELLRTSVWHMLDAQQPSMPHYRTELTEQQTRAIVEYLKTMK